MDSQNTETQIKKKKGRSPSYPGIDIQTALQRARELYAKEKRYQVDVKTAAAHWGYKFGSGISNITLAALKKYDLLVEEGRGSTRKVQLTDLAHRIIIDERDESEERDQLIIRAALTPGIHKALYEQYHEDGLPSDKNLKFELCANRNFTENGAEDFIAQFKRTLKYIESINSGNIGVEEEEVNASEENEESTFANPNKGFSKGGNTPPPPRSGKVKTIQIPMLNTTWPTLTAEFPMTEEQWIYMLEVLKTMKRQLVRNKEKGVESEEKQSE